jgi:hypothetical protein
MENVDNLEKPERGFKNMQPHRRYTKQGRMEIKHKKM